MSRKHRGSGGRLPWQGRMIGKKGRHRPVTTSPRSATPHTTSKAPPCRTTTTRGSKTSSRLNWIQRSFLHLITQAM